MSKIYTIKGKVIGLSSGQGIKGLRVEAWDKDLLIDDFLAEATTSGDGSFKMTFDPSRFQELFLDKSPDVYFKVYKGKKLVLSTEHTVMHNVSKDTEVLLKIKDGKDAGTTPNDDPRPYVAEGVTLLSNMNLDKPNRNNTIVLQRLLGKLGYTINDIERAKGEVGATTIEAVKAFQSSASLEPDGNLTASTTAALNTELVHVHFTKSKPRISKIHENLERIGSSIDPEEKKLRHFSDSTERAVQAFAKSNNIELPQGKITEELIVKLDQEAINQRYTTKNQIGGLHKLMLKAAKTSKLDVQIDATEFKNKSFGPSSVTALETLQKHFGIEATGQLNSTTISRMESAAKSMGTQQRMMSKPNANALGMVKSGLRLNKSSAQVGELQKILAYQGLPISQKEFNTQTFGKTTEKAVRQFQRSYGLTVDGKVGKETQKSLNKAVEKSNPNAVKSSGGSYRVKGSVRDELQERKGNMVIKVYERKLDGTNSEQLASKKNHTSGFFDFSYEPPIDPITGQTKENFHLDIQLYDDQEELIQKKIKYNVASIQWINFNLADEPYQGTPTYFKNLSELTKKLDGTPLIEISETEENRQITLLSKETKLPKETVMRMVLSELVAENINHDEITAETVFAFIKQNFPPRLPGNILNSTMQWELIETIVEDVASGLVFSDQDMIDQLIDSAITGNFVSLSVKQNKEAILEAFKSLRNTFTLEKPILVGNGSLKTILDESVIDEGNYETVSKAFINNSGTNDQFWTELESDGLQAAEISDLQSTFSLALLTKTNSSAISAIKSAIDDPQDDSLNRTSDVAKMNSGQWESFINEKGISVPDNIPGDSEAERITNYALALEDGGSRMFPAVALVAKTKETEHALTQIDNVESFVDEHYDNLSLKADNIDKYVLDNDLQVDETLLSEIKLVQRIYKLAPDALSGATLIGLSLNSAYHIYRQGKNRITRQLVGAGVSVNLATRIYDRARMQYGQVLNRVVEYNSAINNSTPKSIQGYSYNSDAVQELIGEIPNLETLFGGMDVCEWKHCQSMYGPAAYLTDLLRFLGEHDSLVEEDGDLLTVQEILLGRRPDIGNIKLNCPNTLTPMPYIDLVCEILENSMEPQQQDFSHQTTLSTEEVQAIPQYVREHAYKELSTANYPIASTFNLWQEEIRENLNHFRLPRWKLMEAFQDTSGAPLVPTNLDIAGEYFEIASHEVGIITTEAGTVLSQDLYWGIDTTETSVPVRIFLNRTQLTYTQLLNLLMTDFINSDSADPDIAIERPVDTCDLSEQSVINLTTERFDLVNRFLRLWRKTPWEMWELDALLYNSSVGDEDINDDTLIRLKQFAELQERIGVPADVLLGFYGDLLTESRVDAADTDFTIPSVYTRHFNHSSISDGTVNFDIPMSGIAMETDGTGYSPVPVILAALSISQEEFDLLVGFTDGNLTLESVSTLFRYAYLADGLKVSVADLLKYLTATGVSDPFASVEATLNFAEYLDQISESGLSALEIEYILHFDSDSSLGLREETVVQYLEALRTTHETNQELIADLNLSSGDLTTIQAFNSSTLSGLTLAAAETAIGSLQTLLSGLTTNFNDASFALDEVNYIVAFEDASGFVVDTLIEMVDSLQSQLSDLYGNGAKQITALVAGFFDMGEQETEVILNELTAPGIADTLIDVLTDQSILDTDASGDYLELNTTNYQNLFNVIHLVHKISVLQDNVTLTSDQLEWFINNRTSINTLDYGSLPIDGTMPNANFQSWLNLYRFIEFAGHYPEPEDASMIEILDLAIDSANDEADILSLMATLTQWDEDQLQQMVDGFNFQHVLGTLDYADVDTYHRMKKAMAQAKLIGVDIETMFIWASREDHNTQKNITLQSRHAIKSKYDSTVWLDKITPIQNELRVKKRAALVSFLLDHSQRTQSEEISAGVLNPLYWKDANAMYKYFLIDVEMGPDQLTSRIKQAISSVQFFIQRCFLNLENQYVQVSQDEKEDVASENAWSQWKWMKNYRIWEANRKVFFYPENWIEPELRDDKTPFFEELEQQLMQGEVTHDNAEAALLNYLSKLDEVSNLEVMGTYHEFEDLNEQYEGYEIDNVHVLARTKDNPSIYYHRIYDMNYATWSAWEKIDVDIVGDHAVPVVYNRKLHIFWLTFLEKPQHVKKVPAAKASSGPTDAPEAAKVLEIQLAWTVKKDNGWTPKALSKKKLIHPWERPYFSYNLKPFYKNATNELWMDLYITTSREFNDRRFYDPYENGGRYARATHISFNETYRPWHSSSFVFNGKVRDVKMNALDGDYRLLNEDDPTSNEIVSTDSVTYVQSNFGDAGRQVLKFGRYDDGPKIDLPIGMHYHNGHLTNNQNNQVNNSNLNVLVNGTTRTLLSSAINPFEIVVDHQDIPMNLGTLEHPIFYQDYQRCVFIRPEWEEILDEYGELTGRNRQYAASSFYHPYTTLFIRELNRDGIDGLLTRKMQTDPDDYFPGNDFRFTSEYGPASDVVVHDNLKSDMIDFSQSGAYSMYNWELFFHIPMFIANRLTQNQRFEEAMQWYHYIFNPTNIDSADSPQRYWLTKPFYEYNESDYQDQRIENLLTNQETEDFKNQLIAWRNDPFNPHLIARYRPVAYQKNVVMKYIDNLIAWGDQLFRRDTMESINEASLLYMLADEILGERPTDVPRMETEELTFNELPALDDMANVTVEVTVEDTVLPIQITGSSDGMPPLPNLETLYFGIPGNDYLDKYWDTVEDRMFKIRNSMNIDGVKRSLSLFAPPIDPALLVKAAAAGIDLSTVLNDISVGMPIYRFKVMMEKAVAFCQDVTSLGSKLLAALESKDREVLSVIRSQHEVQLLKGIKMVREIEVDEAVETIGGLNKSKEMADERVAFYKKKEYMNAAEIVDFTLKSTAAAIHTGKAIGYTVSAILSLIPDFELGASGFGGTPKATAKTGGEDVSKSGELSMKALDAIAKALEKGATLAEKQAKYIRREEKWKLAKEQAEIESDMVQFQINAAMLRQEISEQQLTNQTEEIERAEEVYDYMRSKYTDEQLYNWMISRISATYFQAYQLAFEMAKKAEICYQYELGIENSSFIQFGYWDSLKKGLLSGESLMHDLRRMEASYLDLNKRELEITKHISLAQVSPLSLINLKQNGECTLSVPEWLIDMDYPGHYMRRIKSVSISIPCVTGPYTSVNCTLSLTKHEMRISSEVGAQYEKEDEDDRFRTKYGAISSIATSHGRNDNGMFELIFKDERYLPFEGTGLDSEWLISLPKENNQFDFSTISDVIIHINYTSRDGGSVLADAARTYTDSIIPESSYRLFSLKHEFPNEWHNFLNPADDNDQEFSVELGAEHYPFYLRSRIGDMNIAKVDWYIQSEETGDFNLLTDVMAGALDAEPGQAISPSSDVDGTHDWEQDVSVAAPSLTGTFGFKLQKDGAGDFTSLTSDDLENVFVVFHFAD